MLMTAEKKGSPGKMSPNKDLQSAFHEEIARTYLKTSEDKAASKKKVMPKFPWIIAALAIILAIAAIVSKSNIDIKVRILGDIPPVSIDVRQTDFNNIRERGIFFIKGSETNGDFVMRTSFMGDARTVSHTTDTEIILCNNRGSGWANYTIELKEPLDLSSLELKFTAKAQKGGEYLGMVIVDSDKRSYRMEKDSSMQLTKDWKLYTVNFAPVKRAIDLKNISMIKFEFGSLTLGNAPGATIFLRDIYVAKARKRWL